MNRYLLGLLSLTLISLASAASAQDPASFPGPEPEHAWLQKFVGEWETTLQCSMGADGKPMESSGVIKSRMLGDFWVVNEMQSAMQGAAMHGLQTIGYDAAKKKYVGTWVDSMMNHMWRYEGTVDESGKKLTLEAEGPNFLAEGKPTQFRDAYEFKTPDHIIVTSSMLGEDGKWTTIMTGESKRTKNKAD